MSPKLTDVAAFLVSLFIYFFYLFSSLCGTKQFYALGYSSQSQTRSNASHEVVHSSFLWLPGRGRVVKQTLFLSMLGRMFAEGDVNMRAPQLGSKIGMAAVRSVAFS